MQNTAEPIVSVVITTYNKKRDVLECLESLNKSNYPTYEVIVVDNGSTDGTGEAIQQCFPNVKLLRGSKNLGVTGGQNLGMKYCNGEYIFFLDHDLVVDKDTLSELVAVTQRDPRVGLVGPIIYYYSDPKKVWAAGTSINLVTGKVSFDAAGKRDVGQFNRVTEVQVLPTYLVRKETINRTGPFDDTFFIVYEDTDFCLRARKIGYKVVCAPKAKAWHKVPLDRHIDEMKIISRTYYIARNRIIFMRKHAKPLHFTVFAVFFVPIFAIYYSLKSLAWKRVDSLLGYWRGMLSGLSYVVKTVHEVKGIRTISAGRSSTEVR